MDNLYKIKRGLDLHLKGVAATVCRKAPSSQVYALMPDDFHGITPRVVVKEGVKVKAGDALFVDKADKNAAF